MSDGKRKSYGWGATDFVAITIPNRKHKIWLTPKQVKAVLKQLEGKDNGQD